MGQVYRVARQFKKYVRVDDQVNLSILILQIANFLIGYHEGFFWEKQDFIKSKTA